MDNTTWYNLGKPLATENYDIAIHNSNSDILDSEMHDRELEIAAAQDAHTALVNSLGFVPWTDFAATLKTEAGVVVAGTSIVYARYMRIGKTVFYKGQASNGAAVVTNAAILLPTGAGLPAKRRELSIGTAVINGSTYPTQMGTARMSSDKLKIVCWSPSGAFVDMPANSDFYWDVSYEVA